MFNQLIRNIRNKKMLHYTPEGVGFESDNIPPETMDLIVKLFNQNNIKASIYSLKTKDTNDKKLLTFSYKNFSKLITVLQ